MKATKSKIATPASLHLQRKASTEPFFKKGGDAILAKEAQSEQQPFFTKPSIQTKLKIGSPNDKYEREADTTAECVVRDLQSGNQATIISQNSSNDIQNKCATCEGEEKEQISKKEESIQRKPIIESTATPTPISQASPINNTLQRQSETPETEELQETDIELQQSSIFESGGTADDDEQNIQRQATGEVSPSPSLESRLNSSRGGGTPLPDDTRSNMESAMGADFSGVRVHTGSDAVQMNQELGAQAFTHGSDIYFNEGKYDTGSSGGQHLLAHELTHTVQQTGGQRSNHIQRATEADVITSLNSAIASSNKQAFMDVLRIENAIHAENTNIYLTIQNHQTSGVLSINEAWQAVCILNYGNDTDRPHPWPEVIRNFFEGIIIGEYTVSNIAPRTKDEILQLAVSISHTEITNSLPRGGGSGLGPFMDYMGKFNSLWGTSTYSGLSNSFDNTLDSKGPKTERSRQIFNHLYASDVQVRNDYDNDVVGVNTGAEKMRELVDQYVGPESRNLVASPRLQRLREEFFTRTLINSNDLTNSAYIAFKSRIRPFAEVLNETDRREIENAHQWRLIIDWTVSGVALRQDLAQYLQSAYLSAAAPVNTNVIIGVGTNISGTTAISSTGPTPVVAPPPPLTPGQQDFVDNMTLHAVNTAITSDTEETTMELFGQSSRDEAGLAFRTRVVINNPANHRGGTGDTIETWPTTSSRGTSHRPRVSTGNGRGVTSYVATLSVEHLNGTPIARTGGTSIPPVTITVTDSRYNAFATRMTNKLFRFFIGGQTQRYSPRDTINYYGGQAPLNVAPLLDSNFRLPSGLVVFSEAEVTQNGNSIATFGPFQFPRGARKSFLGRIISVGPTSPPTPDTMTITVNFREANASGNIFHTRTESFNINESIADAAGTPMAAQLTALSAQLTADKIALNTASPTPPIPASGAGTIIDEMLHHGTPQSARIARTIIAGTIVIEPMIIRPDSYSFFATQIAAGRHRRIRNPNEHVIFALTDSPLDIPPIPMTGSPNSIETAPSVNAIQWNNQIYVHLTTSLGPPPIRRTDFSSIMNTIVHEAVHLVDNRPQSNTDIERYKTEFRAYWMDGNRDHLSTGFDESMNNFGPKSEKARNIFEHLYHSSTYRFVKPAYDNNTNGFRNQVNAFITPDGINLIVSQKLEAIRAEINGFGSSYGPTEQTRVRNLYNGNPGLSITPTNAGERREISGNRYWRTLVESKGFTTSDLTQIKADLNIPS